MSFVAEVHVEAYLNGVRIDRFLVKHFRNYTPYRMQRIVQAGLVQVDDVTVEIPRRVFRGQRVTLRLAEPPDKLFAPENLPLDVLYEDPWIIAVNKPAGQVVHPVGEFQSGALVNALQFHFDRQTAWRGLLRPGIVHRLDRMTSGVIVVSKHHLAHRRLSIGFQRNRVFKTYVALVEGVLPREEGTIDLPIGLAPGGESILMSADPRARGAKQARTEYKVIQRYQDATLLEAVPRTGRIHQIRIHLAHIGYPLLRDEFYGPGGTIKRPRSQAREASLLDRHALHASRLSFVHPITNEPVTFTAPLPEDMIELIESMQRGKPLPACATL